MDKITDKKAIFNFLHCVIINDIDLLVSVYGQEVYIGSALSENRFLLKHPIVVPGREYTRDVIFIDEIQEIISY